MSYDPRYQNAPINMIPTPAQPAQQQFSAPGYPAQQNQQRSDRVPVGGFTAQQFGLETGKYIEYVIEEVRRNNGARFSVIEFYRPFTNRNGEQKRGWNFSFPNGLRELVERINHAQMTYAPEKGIYVFQPQGVQLAPINHQQPQYQQLPQGLR